MSVKFLAQGSNDMPLSGFQSTSKNNPKMVVDCLAKNAYKPCHRQMGRYPRDGFPNPELNYMIKPHHRPMGRYPRDRFPYSELKHKTEIIIPLSENINNCIS